MQTFVGIVATLYILMIFVESKLQLTLLNSSWICCDNHVNFLFLFVYLHFLSFELNPKNGILIEPFYRNGNEAKRMKKQMKAHASQDQRRSRIDSTKKRRNNGLTPSVEQVFLMPGFAQSGFKDGPVDLVGTSSISPSEIRDANTLETDEDDDELLHLSNYLLSISLAPDVLDFDHSCWRSFTLDNLTSKVGEKE